MTPGTSTRCGLKVLVLTSSAFLITSCVGSVQGFTDRAPDGDPIAAARALPDAPEVVQEGNAGTTCGEFVLDQGRALPAEAVACLTAAIEEEEAELAWSYPTTEGDPIVYFAYVSSWNEGVLLSMTNEFDSYGGEFGWTQQSCLDAATATSIDSAGGCRDYIEG
ncbi:hypothetical protein GM708_09970 [Vibrio cholerae]|nr:hypothetical protein [Vibrio cholerae]